MTHASGAELLLGNAIVAEVRAEMARQNLNGVRMAQRLGQSEIWVSRRIKNKQRWTLDDVEMFATALGLTWWQLMEGVRRPGLAEQPPLPISTAATWRSVG